MPSSKKVLIFGIDSFTGSFLKDELEREGLTVVGTSFVKGDPMCCDITDYESCKRIIENEQADYLINLAGISYVPHGKVQDIYAVNFMGVVNILEALIECKQTPKILLISSAQVYDPIDGQALTERNALSPASHYANSKRVMEQAVQVYTDRLNINLARPFNYTGVGQSEKFVLPKLIKHFKERKAVIELGDVSVRRDFSDVRDVVSAYKTILLDDSVNEVYNICSNIDVSISELIADLTQATGHDIEVVINQKFIRAKDIQVLKGDNEKLKSLSWCPNHTIKDTLLWMMNN